MGTLAAIGALAGGLGSGLSEGTQNALRQLQAQAMKDSEQGSTQAGQILSQLYGGPTGAPQQGGLGGLLKGLFGGGGQPPTGAPSPPPSQMGPPMPPGMAQGGAQPGQGPSSQSQPQGQPAAPGGPPGPQQIQMMQLPDIVAAAKRVNPNMTPQQLMAAIDRLQPLMNSQALQQYRMVQLQLGQQRATTGQGNLEERQRHDVATETEKSSEFQQRQTSIKDRFDKLLDEKYTALGQAKDIAERRNIVTQAEAAIKDSLAATRAEIASSGVQGPDRDKLMKEAAQQADAARERIAETARVKQSSDTQQSTAPAKPGKTTSDAPVRKEGEPKTTERAVGQTMQGPDGKTWRYKGGDWDDQASWEVVK